MYKPTGCMIRINVKAGSVTVMSLHADLNHIFYVQEVKLIKIQRRGHAHQLSINPRNDSKEVFRVCKLL